MEALERNHISIDTWAPLFPEKTTFLLTHVHTDHANIPKKFTHPVYTSYQTRCIWHHPALQCVLHPGQWYRTRYTCIPFLVLSTEHTFESIGFLFPTLHILYMGDCMCSIIPSIPRNLIVVYDGLYEHVTTLFPTMQESCCLIKQALDTTCPVIQIVHHGILSALSSHCKLTFRIDTASVPDIVQKAADALHMVNKNSPYLLVGRMYTNGPRIIPSSYWFMYKNREKVVRDPFKIHSDGADILRVFCCLHTRSQDIKSWKQMHPYALFEKMSSNRV